MGMREAQTQACAQALERVRTLDIPTRCAQLGLTAPDKHGKLHLTFLGKPATIDLRGTDILLPPGDALLILTYLLCEHPLADVDKELITFRDFPGGAFYFGPFTQRTTAPLINTFTGKLPLLRQSLKHYEHEILTECAHEIHARVRAIGHVHLTLIYRAGDEEFPDSADLLFNTQAIRVYTADHAAALASKFCFGLVRAAKG